MTDIVERLRELAKALSFPLASEAANEIERLRAAVEDAQTLIDNDLVGPWIAAHKLDEILK